MFAPSDHEALAASCLMSSAAWRSLILFRTYRYSPSRQSSEEVTMATTGLAALAVTPASITNAPPDARSWQWFLIAAAKVGTS